MGLFARSSTLWNRNTLLAAALIIVIGAGALIFLRPSERERKINYHLSKLEDEALAMTSPQNLREALSWRRIRYALSRRFSSRIESGRELQTHREALINLGYFTEHRFELGSTNLFRQLYPAVMAAGLKETNWSYYAKNGTNIFVTTAIFEIPKWEQIVSNLNRSDSNQH